MSRASEVSKPSWLSLAGVGLAGGLFAGVFGVGGGLIMVPLLLWWTTLDQKRAHATSLLAITPVAVIGGVSYAVGGVFAWLPAIFVAIGGIFGAQIGAWLLRKVPVGFLRWGFIAFILASGVMLLIQLPDRSVVLDITITSAAILLGLGVAMGISAGLFGIGGGVIVIPVLMLFFGQSDLVAKSISLLAMAPGAISGSISALLACSAAAVARVFMENRALFGLAPNAPVVPALREELALPAAAGHVLTFDLTVDGVPLDGGSLAARLRPDGRLAELRMDPLPARLVGLASAPRLSPEAARAAAVALGTDPRLVGAAALVYFAAAPSEGRLAWRVPVAARPLADHGYVWLDATDGTLLARRAATLH